MFLGISCYYIERYNSNNVILALALLLGGITLTIVDYLQKNAENCSEKAALIERMYCSNNAEKWNESKVKRNNVDMLTRRMITWFEFDRKSNQVANMLLENGAQKGDKIAILMENCIEWLIIFFGILKIGAVTVSINCNYAINELQYCLELSDSTILFFSQCHTDKISSIKEQGTILNKCICVGQNVPNYSLDYKSIDNNYSTRFHNYDLVDTDLAAIYFSSGTTGLPKAVLHTHKALLFSAQTEQEHHQQTSEDVFLCIPPLFHMGAKVHWLGSLISGGSAILLCNVSPRWIFQTITQEKITIVFLLLPWAQDIIDAINEEDLEIDKYDLSHWRLTHLGAQPIPPQIIKSWLSMFPQQKFDINYGLTESCGPGCVHLGINNTHKLETIGKAGYGWKTSIVDNEGVPVNTGTIGELAVKGNGLMVGYYKDKQSTEKAIKNNWLMTGDLAYEDEDGFICLVGRKKDLIICGGENVYPIEIESFLSSLTQIKDVAIIGAPNNRLGEEIVAVVELKNGVQCKKTEIKKYCVGLPPYKRPHKIIFAKIPRNATGKIDKEKLRKKLGITSVWEKL